ncbi:AmmeMemoRadiSam system protein B [Niveibacterium sp. 24ML]|uniref:AmmeMemoRadiSam system protein B n=1 Tax=Niveibacterium sp. 24ML TaxID=2985512 RepID=UPI00226EF033|nr:AmmeMemoRadiSam system protein B [Niveibacterium sp. 24ML]MCX9156695.1 AmmeMemoRadiSam system protein B [Niveibacterium sp. 24ML]
MNQACIRQPAVAGAFYPGDAASLNANVVRMLGHAAASAQKAHASCPKCLIVPHAGYVYSGNTAAHAYALLKPWARQIHRVVLLGPSHRVPLHGIALPDVDAFATPLGLIPLDQDAIALVRTMPGICVYDAAHAAEHSLEVQLPFLQTVLTQFTLVPLSVGHADAQTVAAVISQLWGGPETLIVLSTDLSHFHAYREAQELDHDTVANILALAPTVTPEQACGAYPLNGLLKAAERHHLSTELLDHCNSGDTAGDHRRVVGYCAVALYETPGHVV